MSISFSRSTRALDHDSFRVPILGLAIASLVLIAWGAWFVMARITVQETSTHLTVDQDGAVSATFTPAQIARIQVGQAATVELAATNDAPAQILRAQVAQVANRSANRMEPNTVRFFILDHPPIATARQVSVVVAELSPLTFVLQNNQAFASAGRGN